MSDNYMYTRFWILRQICHFELNEKRVRVFVVEVVIINSFDNYIALYSIIIITASVILKRVLSIRRLL